MPARTVANQCQRGDLVAAALAGAWRPVPPPWTLSPGDFAEIASPLLKTGSGALAWGRLCRSPTSIAPAATALRQAYRHNTLERVHHEELLQRVLRLLRYYGVDPVLVKGWSVVRLYPAPGLRSCGDMDLCVHPDQLQNAITILTTKGTGFPVDLHQGVADLEDRSWQEVTRRSRLVRSGDVEVRVLSPEDQLRHLCLHLLRHGAWRPLWLCDVATALEACQPDFDWDYCLSGNPRLTEWVVCAMGLACRLLGARVQESAIVGRLPALPPWLITTVLRLWGAGTQGDSHRVERPLASYWRNPAGLLGAVCSRWPSPIEAVFKMRGSPFTRLPTRLFQLRAFLARLLRYPTTLREVRFAAGLPFDLHT